jgi:transposase-like protein
VTAGTLFQYTRIPLTVWFETIWLMTVPKNGVSAQHLYQVLPIGSYQTAWTMLTKLRTAMTSIDKAKLSGTVEVDEWFHGGIAKGGTALSGKNIVAGAVEHTPGGGFGRIRLRVIAARTTWDLRKFIHATIEPGSRIITDALSAYQGAMAGYTHEPRNESAPDTAPPHELLPGVHRIFSLTDRWLLGTHQGGIQAEHLQEYLDEFTFRFNRRGARHRGMVFYRLLQHAITAGPATYRDLVRIGATTPTPPLSRPGSGGGSPGSTSDQRWRPNGSRLPPGRRALGSTSMLADVAALDRATFVRAASMRWVSVAGGGPSGSGLVMWWRSR